MSAILPVHETFSSTIQGEGYWAGAIVDFIRLHGCPVGCEFCDSLYAPQDGGGKLAPRTPRTIAELVAELQSPRVVISGGEPFIHKSLPLLVEAIEATGREVSIETSGAFWQPISKTSWVTLSPKQHVSPRYAVHPAMWLRADEIKIVIALGNELEFYRQPMNHWMQWFDDWGYQYWTEYEPFLSCSTVTTERFLQPEWQELWRTLPLTLELLRSHPDYRLSVQLHKVIGVQ